MAVLLTKLIDGTSPAGVVAALVVAAAALLWKLVAGLLLRSKAPPPGAAEHEKAKPAHAPETPPDGFDSMGPIEALPDLDYTAQRPERIYKFADRYNLTMGTSLHAARAALE